MCGSEVKLVHCGICWGVYNHADKCPVGQRLKALRVETNEEARKKHLEDIEILNQNARGK